MGLMDDEHNAGVPPDKNSTDFERQEGSVALEEVSVSVLPDNPLSANTAHVPNETACSVHPPPDTPISDAPETPLGVNPDNTPPRPPLLRLAGDTPHPFVRTALKDLPADRMEAMFMEYYDNPNLALIAKKFDVPYKTVSRYATIKNWEGRRAKILARAEEKTDYTLERATEQSLLMVRAAKNKLAERLKDINAKNIDPDKVFGEIERVIRLEQLLLGGSESRKESVTQTHEERMRELREARINAAKNVTPELSDGEGGGSGKPN